MKLLIAHVVVTLAAAGGVGTRNLNTGNDSKRDHVNLSYQPAYHGIPVFMAVELGWFDELGIDVDFSVWDSGGPQVAAAVDEDAWDFGVAGSVPNIIAGLNGIWTVGISNDESKANSMVGGPSVTEYPPSELTPNIFAQTPGSTGAFMMSECLTNSGVEFTEENFIEGSQGDVRNFLEDGTSSYGALWAPNSYSYLSANPSAKEFCNGALGAITIYGGLMMRSEWSEANPMLAAKVLAAYLRGVAMMHNYNMRDKVLDISEKFYESVGKDISRQDMERDILSREIFPLDKQLSIMSRNFVNGDTSTVDQTFTDLANFLVGIGNLEEALPATDYITDKYLKLISKDEWMREWICQGSAGGS